MDDWRDSDCKEMSWRILQSHFVLYKPQFSDLWHIHGSLIRRALPLESVDSRPPDFDAIVSQMRPLYRWIETIGPDVAIDALKIIDLTCLTLINLKKVGEEPTWDALLKTTSACVDHTLGKRFALRVQLRFEKWLGMALGLYPLTETATNDVDLRDPDPGGTTQNSPKKFEFRYESQRLILYTDGRECTGLSERSVAILLNLAARRWSGSPPGGLADKREHLKDENGHAYKNLCKQLIALGYRDILASSDDQPGSIYLAADRSSIKIHNSVQLFRSSWHRKRIENALKNQPIKGTARIDVLDFIHEIEQMFRYLTTNEQLVDEALTLGKLKPRLNAQDHTLTHRIAAALKGASSLK